VRLRGTLLERTFPGPNDEELPAAQWTDRAWLLVLDTPVCVAADPKSEVNDVDESEVVLLHLAPAADSVRRRLRGSLGQHLEVRGTLFHAITGFHHTAVLLWAETVRPLPAKGPRPSR
jgi:hypothetical protein